MLSRMHLDVPCFSVDGEVPFKPHTALRLVLRADVVKLRFTKLLRPAKLEVRISFGNLSTEAWSEA